MIKKKNYITKTLLDSWNYGFKKGDFTDFISYLKREKREQTQAMIDGLQFEEFVCNGGDEEFSPLIKDGIFQYGKEKIITVDGIEIKLFGYLDVLKDGIIYDIKCTSFYEVGKFYDSTQHLIYFKLVPEAEKFIYLIYNKKNGEHYKEEYSRYDAPPVELETLIHQFFEWLKQNDLFEIYLENFQR